MATLDEVRAAFAAGWADTSAPLTDAVKASCAAHLRWAAGRLDDPGLIEATIDTGHLTGVWQTIHDRRETLHARHEQAVLQAWYHVVTELPVREAVQRYRAALGLHEATQDDKDRKARLKAAATAAIGWLLSHVRQSRQETALLDTLGEAVREGMAEGATTAVLLAAEQAAATADPDLVYAARLSEAVVPDGTAAQVETAILSGATIDATRVLTKPDPTDTPVDDLADAVTGELESADGAAAYFTDVAVGRGYTAGMLGTWVRLGSATVTFQTVGDSRVCPKCEAAEAGNPYPIMGAPHPPLHGRCRCVLIADGRNWPYNIIAPLLGG